MKKILLLASFVCFVQLVAVGQTGSAQIKGTVVDSTKASALDYVTVALREVGKTDAVKTMYTEANGSFSFSNLLLKPYEVIITFVGYKTKTVKVPALTTADATVDLGKVQLAPTASQLKEVQITAQKQLIKQDVDKITYDVEADPESKSQTALDMLRKLPLVSVDGEDNIQVKGSGNFLVLVNGKTSSLFVRNPKDVLKTMPANSIKSIEVITNPPAKYDAEGVGGIINIITNKKAPAGYNGSVNMGVRDPFGYFLGTNITLKTGKFGLTGYSEVGEYSNPTRPSNFIRNDYRIEEGRYVADRNLQQIGFRNNNGDYKFFNGQVSYELDSLNLLTANYNLNFGRFFNRQRQFVTYSQVNQGEAEQYNRFMNNNGDWHGNDVGLDYQKTFKKNKDQIFTLSYKINGGGEGYFSNFWVEPILNYQARYNRNFNDAKTREQTIQADYVQPMGKNSLEAGLKTILRDNYSDFSYSDGDGAGNFVEDTNRGNVFDYDQDIIAGYTSYSYKKDKWGLKAGARLENTMVHGDFQNRINTVIEQNYFNLIPSIALSRTLKDQKTVKVSYTQRIERPSIWVLNPYVDDADPKRRFYGNPELEAATTHAFEAASTTFYKGSSINNSVYYNFSNNSIQQYAKPAVNGVSEVTFGNIGQNRTLGTSFNTNITLKKNLNFNANANVRYVYLTGFVNNTRQENEGATANINLGGGYTVAKKVRFSTNLGYNTPNVMLQGRSSGFMWHNIFVKYTFIKDDKAYFQAGFISPFMQTFRGFTEYTEEGFYQLQENRWQTRRLNISLNYRFGKLKGDIAKKKRGINNDDVKGGGQGSGS